MQARKQDLKDYRKENAKRSHRLRTVFGGGIVDGDGDGKDFRQSSSVMTCIERIVELYSYCSILPVASLSHGTTHPPPLIPEATDVLFAKCVRVRFQDHSTTRGVDRGVFVARHSSVSCHSVCDNFPWQCDE